MKNEVSKGILLRAESVAFVLTIFFGVILVLYFPWFPDYGIAFVVALIVVQIVAARTLKVFLKANHRNE